jgi:cell fate (sporulation/competence/biofilm development) regulator YmcA (YheA/YmcA/DUF963 family)
MKQPFQEFKTYKMSDKEIKKPLTIEQRIEQLKAQQEQAKEVFMKCVGAIEVLEQMIQQMSKK